MHTHTILTEIGIKNKPSEPKVLGGDPKHFGTDGKGKYGDALQIAS